MVEPQKTIIILNKIDLKTFVDKDTDLISNFKNVVKISALKKDGIENLYQMISQLFNFNEINLDNEIVITNERHKNILKNAITNIKKAEDSIDKNMPIDIVAISIKNVLSNLGEITGDVASEEIINEIFARFCLGK